MLNAPKTQGRRANIENNSNTNCITQKTITIKTTSKAYKLNTRLNITIKINALRPLPPYKEKEREKKNKNKNKLVIYIKKK